MPKGSPRKKNPNLRRFAAFFVGYGAGYLATLAYPDLPPAKLMLGAGNVMLLGLVNGLIYGVVAMLIVIALYSSR